MKWPQFCVPILLIFFYLQFLVCGGPSSSLSKGKSGCTEGQLKWYYQFIFSQLWEKEVKRAETDQNQQVQFQKLKFTLFKSNIHTK